MKILILDNYDSFTYNLFHLVESVCDYEIQVHRNDKIDLDKVSEFDKIILSPGPGLPIDAGILIEVIKHFSQTKSILGVCLGHQAIVEAFGGSLINLDTVFHGVATPINIIKEDQLLKDISSPFEVGRYHSWVANPKTLPDCLEILAQDESHNIMAIRHKSLNIRGVQFHPESIMTEYGKELIKNWLEFL